MRANFQWRKEVSTPQSITLWNGNNGCQMPSQRLSAERFFITFLARPHSQSHPSSYIIARNHFHNKQFSHPLFHCFGTCITCFGLLQSRDTTLWTPRELSGAYMLIASLQIVSYTVFRQRPFLYQISIQLKVLITCLRYPSKYILLAHELPIHRHLPLLIKVVYFANMHFKLLALSTLLTTAFAAPSELASRTSKWAVVDFKRGQYTPEASFKNGEKSVELIKE